VEEKNLYPLQGIEPRFLGRPALSIVTTLSVLRRLQILFFGKGNLKKNLSEAIIILKIQGHNYDMYSKLA